MKLSIRQRNILRLAAIVALAVLIVSVIVIAAPYVAPFVAGLVIYLLAKPLARLLHEKLRIHSTITAAITIVLIVGLLFFAITSLVIALVNEVQILIETFPTWSQDLYTWLDNAFDFLRERFDMLHPSVSSTLDSTLNSIFARLSTFIGSLASRTLIALTGIPQALIFIVATVFCAFMLIADHDKMKAFFARHTPDNWLKTFYEVRNGMFSALFGYIRAQFVMLIITFTELLVAFFILKVNYAVLLALVIALIDMLPVFGAGLFLIPWTLYSFFVGDIGMGIGIGVLYATTIIVRQSIEPRLIGRNIGIYPMLTLVAMYAGLRLWGVFGLLLGPVSVMLVKNVFTYMLGGMTFKEFVDHDPDAPASDPPGDSPGTPPDTPPPDEPVAVIEVIEE